jgi:hypothetical protein
MTNTQHHTSEVAMAGEIIEDDGSHTLTIGAISDVEIRLHVMTSMLRNPHVTQKERADIFILADATVKYIKTGE